MKSIEFRCDYRNTPEFYDKYLFGEQKFAVFRERPYFIIDLHFEVVDMVTDAF